MTQANRSIRRSTRLCLLLIPVIASHKLTTQAQRLAHNPGEPNSKSGRADGVKARRSVNRRIGKLIMARRKFRGVAETGPVVCRNSDIGISQNGEVDPERISKCELKLAGRKFRRCSQQKRGGD